MLFTGLVGVLSTLLVAVTASSRGKKETVFYNSDEEEERVKYVPKSANRLTWLVDAFHSTLFDSLVAKARVLGKNCENASTKEEYEQAWAPYAEAIIEASQWRLEIMQSELRKIYVKNSGVPVASEKEALKLFQRKITHHTLDKIEEKVDVDEDKEYLQRKRERELVKKEKEIKEQKKDEEKERRREDKHRTSDRGFTYVRGSKKRDRGSRY